MLSLVLHYHLFNPARRVSVHENPLTRLAHLKHFILVHGTEDKLFPWHVHDELLSLDHVKHLTDLIFAKCVDEVNFIEIHKNCVLASFCEWTSHLTLVHLHQTLDHSIVLSRQYSTQWVNHILLV